MDDSTASSRTRAFSLIELLVVIAIIGLLIALFVPTLARVRERGRDTVCLSNHRQFGIAFGAYAADFDSFPISDYTTYIGVLNCWGGVDWYLDDAGEPQWIDPKRPLNPYVGAQREHAFRLDVFQCPRDDGMRHYNTDEIVDWQTDFGLQTIDREGPHSIYSVLGNSYGANGWMYCTPGSDNGIGQYPDLPNFRTDLGPDDVECIPSRFVMVCDLGPNWPGRYPVERRQFTNIVYGWWHGYEIGNMTFLDGSARAEKMGDVTTQTYTFYMAPDRHGPMSFRTFDRY